MFCDTIIDAFEQTPLTVNFSSPFRTWTKTRGRKLILDSVDLEGLELFFLNLLNLFISRVWYLVWFHWLRTTGLIFRCRHLYRLYGSIGWAVLKFVVESRTNWSFVTSAARKSWVWWVIEWYVCSVGCLSCDFCFVLQIRTEKWVLGRMLRNHEFSHQLDFDFTRLVIHAGINYPGSWHNSKVAAIYGFYDHNLMAHTPTCYAILVDSEFTRTERAFDCKFVRGKKANERVIERIVPNYTWARWRCC